MGLIGKHTMKFKNPPVIIAAYSTAGPREAQGPLGSYFDYKLEDELLGEETWEKAEARMITETISRLLKRAHKEASDIDYIYAGDLQNQVMGSTFGVKDFNIPFFGLYGACSTLGEAITLASVNIEAGMADLIIAGTSSHNCVAEKQFRFPLEYGGQRTETQTWTSTASGFVLLSRNGEGPCVTAATPGKIVDLGVTDTFNMGAAMAPAAVDTILTHLEDTNQKPEDFDAIITGDLGKCGYDIAIDLAGKMGVDLSKVLNDGGKIMYNENQGTKSGGSGCGCIASIFTGYLYKQMLEKKMKKILIVPTGAMLSQSSTQQGHSIPGIAYGVCIEMK